MTKFVAIALCTLVLASCTHAGPQQGSCAVTPAVLATPPDDEAVQGPPVEAYYHVNANRTIWAAAPTALSAGGGEHKIPWFRPPGAALEITGRRLDGAAGPLEATIPCCYRTRFQSSAVRFPAAGCWEVVGRAAGEELWFVVLVAPGEPT